MALPDAMPPEALIYRWFAATWHWTPAQVDELPLDAYIWLMPIEMAADEVARRSQKRDAPQAQSRARRR